MIHKGQHTLVLHAKIIKVQYSHFFPISNHFWVTIKYLPVIVFNNNGQKENKIAFRQNAISQAIIFLGLSGNDLIEGPNWRSLISRENGKLSLLLVY
jgi:hypothetical protein